MTILKTAPVGLAFAVTHLEIVSVLLVSVFFLAETLNATQLTGRAAILAGVGILCPQQQYDFLRVCCDVGSWQRKCP